MSRARDVADFIPTGGVGGQVLTKNSADDYDTAWKNIIGAVPSPGVDDVGKALVVNDDNETQWGADIDSEDQVIDGGETVV